VELDEYVVPPFWRLHGSHEVVALPSPAAGAALTYTVPGAVQQTPLSIVFTYTASGNAANRFPSVAFLDWSGNPFFEAQSPFKLIATNVAVVSFAVDIAQFGADSAAALGSPIPALRLGDGLRVQLSATGIDVADTITLARMFVHQFDVRPDLD
jgi:hypothetical protein